jgi:predicted DNA-binding protein
MKSAKFDQSPNMDERLVIAVPTELKARVYAAAIRRGLPASVLLRQAVNAFIEKAA